MEHPKDAWKSAVYGDTSSKSCCWYETEGGVRREEVGWSDAVVDHCDAHAEAHDEAHDRNLDDGMVAHDVEHAADCYGAVEARYTVHRLGRLVQKKTHLVDESAR